MHTLRHGLILAVAVLVLAAIAGSATTAPATGQWNPWECEVTAVEPAEYAGGIWSHGQIKCGQYMDVYVLNCLQWFDRVDQVYYTVECAENSATRFAGHLWARVIHPCFPGRFRTWTHGHAQWPDGSGAWSDNVVSQPTGPFCW